MDYMQGNVAIKPKMSVSIKSARSLGEVKESTQLEITSEYLEESINELGSLEQLPPESSSRLSVPPTTPGPAFSFEQVYSPVSRPFPAFEDLKIPYVREVGIKNCLEMLSGYFNCKDYKLNTVQFWFLDVITDCLWKMQDEFQFPERYQKIIVEWILYLMDLIRDPQRNLSRKEFFRIFNEALIIGNERVQAGCEILPSPSDLFAVVEDEEEEVISFPSTTPTTEQNSSVSLTSRETDKESYVAIGIDENTEIFKLPKPPPRYYKHVDFSDTIIKKSVEEEELLGEEETIVHTSELESVEFYQPDPNTPERFLSSSSSSFQSITEQSDDFISLKEERFLWKRSSSSMNKVRKICSDEIFASGEPSTTIIPQRIKYIKVPESTIDQADSNNIQQEWINYLEGREEYVQGMEKNILINSCALFAIKQFVYDYFYETFQYTIIKFALINNFSAITQKINTTWHIPKVLKEELKRPKPKKEKKKKKKKDKKKKKPKKKTKGKKDKKKSKKAKSKKGSKKSKKPKKKKLTKEEKAELARRKREQEKWEEEMRTAEENRRLLFPLKEATDDDFFEQIFENWVKPKKKEKKGKDKKAEKIKK